MLPSPVQSQSLQQLSGPVESAEPYRQEVDTINKNYITHFVYGINCDCIYGGYIGFANLTSMDFLGKKDIAFLRENLKGKPRNTIWVLTRSTNGRKILGEVK